MDRAGKIIADQQNRDDNIYRVILESEPIPGSIREAGIGGIDRYEALKGYSTSDLIIETEKKMDKIMSQLYVQSKSFDEVFMLAKNKEKMLSSIPAGTSIHNIELRPGKGGQMCRSAGTSAALIKNETDGYSVLRLPSGATHLMSVKVVSMYVSVLFAGNFLE